MRVLVSRLTSAALGLLALVMAVIAPAPGAAQGVIQQVGPATSGHPVLWWSNGQVIDSSQFPGWLSSALDLYIGASPGDMICRGPSGWIAVPPGAGGQFLQAQGANCPLWSTGGSTFANPQRTITTGANDTATTSDGTISWNSATASAKTETIYGCNSSVSGRVLIIKDEKGTASTLPITISPASGSIEGIGSYVLTSNGQAVQLQCDGSTSNWMAISVPGQLGQYIASGPTTLVTGQIYVVNTSGGAETLNLPSLSGVASGQFIVIMDGSNNASVNNITVTANGSDTIAYYNVSASSAVLNTNNAAIWLFKTNGGWRAVPF